LAGDGVDAAAVGLDDEIGDLAVERLAHGHELREHLLARPVLEQGTLASAIGALELLPDAGVQVDDEAARAEAAAAVGVEDGAAAGREDDALPLGELVDHCRLAAAEAGLALFLEDERDVDARAPLDLLVAVDEVEVEQLRELPPHRGLARAHRSYEEQVLRLCHDIKMRRRTGRGPPCCACASPARRAPVRAARNARWCRPVSGLQRWGTARNERCPTA